jgi:hypothetical protein
MNYIEKEIQKMLAKDVEDKVYVVEQLQIIYKDRFEVWEANKEEDYKQHIDFFMKDLKSGNLYGVDLKIKSDTSYIIEIKNNHGYPGWGLFNVKGKREVIKYSEKYKEEEIIPLMMFVVENGGYISDNRCAKTVIGKEVFLVDKIEMYNKFIVGTNNLPIVYDKKLFISGKNLYSREKSHGHLDLMTGVPFEEMIKLALKRIQLY